ncbi:hypothetical protein MRX96_054716 [Rhipicephalus microplus]
MERNPVMSSRPMETHSSVESPVEPVSPPGTRVGYSFDSYEAEPYAVQETRPWWQLLWAFSSIVFITVLMPTIVFFMSHTMRTVRAPPTFSFVPGATSVNVTSSPSTIPRTTTTGLPRVTFDADENFLLQPGETLLHFCKRQTEPDQRSRTTPVAFDEVFQREHEGRTTAAGHLRLRC